VGVPDSEQELLRDLEGDKAMMREKGSCGNCV
jgi:hypothetical protein